MTVDELLRSATAELTRAGVDAARVDAELLLAHCLDVPRSRLRPAADVDAATVHRFRALLARRVAREPHQYVVGEAPFRHLVLQVGPGVFIPRPETELLVDAVLPFVRAMAHPVVVDLCAGSGALALAIAGEAPGSQVIAVEDDPAAGAWLARNVAAGGAGRRVDIRTTDVTDPDVLADLAGTVDVVVANPPYVPAAVEVAPEVRADPARAVFAGPLGLDVIGSLIPLAARLLRARGLLALEHDDTHGETVPALLSADGRWDEIVAHRDLAGRPRFATAVRAGTAT